MIARPGGMDPERWRERQEARERAELELDVDNLREREAALLELGAGEPGSRMAPALELIRDRLARDARKRGGAAPEPDTTRAYPWGPKR